MLLARKRAKHKGISWIGNCGVLQGASGMETKSELITGTKVYHLEMGLELGLLCEAMRRAVIPAVTESRLPCQEHSSMSYGF